MQISERNPGDVALLRKRARRERRAEQKDRYLVALHAAGEMETAEIQRVLCRSRGFVQRWAYAYRDGGIDALRDKPRGGSIGKITGDTFVRLKARIDAGPTPADKVCTLRGKDIQRIAREELGTSVSLSCVYRTLDQMEYSCLVPRPRHEQQDPEAQKKFKEETAPFLSAH